jgi:hypothetical protein
VFFPHLDISGTNLKAPPSQLSIKSTFFRALRQFAWLFENKSGRAIHLHEIYEVEHPKRKKPRNREAIIETLGAAAGLDPATFRL